MADLLVVHAPSELDWSQKPLSGVRAEQAMLICHQVADYLSSRGPVRLSPFPVSRFVLFSSRNSVGGGPYVVEAAYPLAA